MSTLNIGPGQNTDAIFQTRVASERGPPIEKSAGLSLYERPIKDHTYFITADVARGTKNDSSAFICFDVTTVPYKIVAVFKDNEIKPLMFPNKIKDPSCPYVLFEKRLIEKIDVYLKYTNEAFWWFWRGFL